MLRELLSGSIIETKLGDVFYFSHRSLQEFLIAERVVIDGAKDARIIGSKFLTPETAGFISENPNHEDQLRLLNEISRADYFSVITYDAIYPTYKKLILAGKVDLHDVSTIWLWLFSAVRRMKIEMRTTIQKCYQIYEALDNVPGIETNELGPIFAEQLLPILHSDDNEHPAIKVLPLAFIKYCLSKLPFEKFFALPAAIMTIDETDSPFARVIPNGFELRRSKNSDLVINFAIGPRIYDRETQNTGKLLMLYGRHFEIKNVRLSDLGPQSDPVISKLREAFSLSNGKLHFVRQQEKSADMVNPKT